MVASTSEIASRIGADMMKKGGNAVDAAVAVALALAVTWPAAGNLGGGGFMLIRSADGTTEAIDYRERAPLAATRDMYLDANGNVIKGMSTDGYKAVGVPGTVAGLVLAHKRHGKLEMARPGRAGAQTRRRRVHRQRLSRRRSFAEEETLEEDATRGRRAAASFFATARRYGMGERFVQPELAATLARIRDRSARLLRGR